MLSTKQIDRTQAHTEKKNNLKINQTGDRNQVGWVSNTRQLSGWKFMRPYAFKAEVKNGVTYKKTCIAMTDLIK